MNNQFFYTERVPDPVATAAATPEGENPTILYREMQHSFNVDKVIRTAEFPDGSRAVLLDDIHERPVPVEVRNKKGTVTATRKEKDIFQTEIRLSPKDSAAFVAFCTGINATASEV